MHRFNASYFQETYSFKNDFITIRAAKCSFIAFCGIFHNFFEYFVRLKSERNGKNFFRKIDNFWARGAAGLYIGLVVPFLG